MMVLLLSRIFCPSFTKRSWTLLYTTNPSTVFYHRKNILLDITLYKSASYLKRWRKIGKCQKCTIITAKQNMIACDKCDHWYIGILNVPTTAHLPMCKTRLFILCQELCWRRLWVKWKLAVHWVWKWNKDKIMTDYQHATYQCFLSSDHNVLLSSEHIVLYSVGGKARHARQGRRHPPPHKIS